jgi:hypothetical protein
MDEYIQCAEQILSDTAMNITSAAGAAQVAKYGRISIVYLPDHLLSCSVM